MKATQAATSNPSISQMSEIEKASAPITADEEEMDSLIKRRSRLESSQEAFQYVSSISKDNYVRLRLSDRLTSIALVAAAILAILSIVVHPLAILRLPLILLCDGLVGTMLVLYLLNRFGILIALTPRQALLTWQMIVVSCVVGIYVTINLAALVAGLVLSPSFLSKP